MTGQQPMKSGSKTWSDELDNLNDPKLLAMLRSEVELWYNTRGRWVHKSMTRDDAFSEAWIILKNKRHHYDPKRSPLPAFLRVLVRTKLSDVAKAIRTKPLKSAYQVDEKPVPPTLDPPDLSRVLSEINPKDDADLWLRYRAGMIAKESIMELLDLPTSKEFHVWDSKHLKRTYAVRKTLDGKA
jgi:DNA-directed RNA polymerase specialized sigma24 family protein